MDSRECQPSNIVALLPFLVKGARTTTLRARRYRAFSRGWAFRPIHTRRGSERLAAQIRKGPDTASRAASVTRFRRRDCVPPAAQRPAPPPHVAWRSSR